MTVAVGLAGFSAAVISDVARDFECLEAGVRVCYLMDPHELVEYCFPLGIFADEKKQLIDEERLALISDTQNALYEVLHNWDQAPLLVSEYSHELSRIEHYLRWQAARVYRQMDVVRRLVEAGTFVTEHDQETEGILVSLVEKEFNVALAVASGLFSLGVDRLTELFKTRLLAVQDMDSRMVRQALDDYRPSTLVDMVFDELQAAYTRDDDDPALRERRNRGFLTDARAIDKLLFLNSWFCDESRLIGGLPEYLFLYVSSAARSAKVFAMREVERRMPVLRNAPYALWRTREHLFAHVVHKRPKRFQTHRALQKTFKAMQDLAKGPSNSSKRQQVAGTHSVTDIQAGLALLSPVEQAIAPVRAAMANLNLGINVEAYRRLYERAQEIVKLSPQSGKVLECFSLFADVFENVGFRDLALDRMRSLAELMSLMVEPGIEELTPEGEYITVAVQRLPIKARFVDPVYREMFADIRDFLETPITRRPLRQNQLKRAYLRFDELDREIPAARRVPEHELLRCFLYIAFPAEDGDERAFNAASDQLERHTTIDAEFAYVACWAARRLGWNEYARALALNSVLEHPADGRFLHALSLNAFAWTQKRGRKPDASLAAAIQYAREAINLYKQEDAEGNRDVIAVNWHNIAYFCTKNPRDDAFSVDSGRTAIEELKDIVPSTTWTPGYPEYHHSEALVEFREYQRLRRERRPKDDLCTKLRWAQSALDEAMRGYHKKIYHDLARDIEKARLRHGCEEQA